MRDISGEITRFVESRQKEVPEGRDWATFDQKLGLSEVLEAFSQKVRIETWCVVQCLVVAKTTLDPFLAEALQVRAQGAAAGIQAFKPVPENFRSWFDVFDKLAEELKPEAE